MAIIIGFEEEYVIGTAELKVNYPKIEDCFWSSDQAGKNKIDTANLETEVYFHLKTSGITKGSMTLQLFDEDTFCDDKEFDGKEIKLTVNIENNKAVVKLSLPASWANDLKNEEWAIGPNIHYRKLYWEANYGKRIKNEQIDAFLKVFFSKKKLYIKPSSLDNKFPEMYSKEGEYILPVIIQPCLIEKMEDQVSNVIEKGQAKYALARLAKGHMVDNQGVIHKIGESRYVSRARIVEEMTISTNEGLILKTTRSKDLIYSVRESGERVVHTSKGIDQYGFWINDSKAKIFHIDGLIRNTGNLLDLFDLTKFGTDLDHGSPLPAIGAATGIGMLVDVLGIVAYERFDEIEAEIQQAYDTQRATVLTNAKAQGLDKVKRLLVLEDKEYDLLDINKEIASRIQEGKYDTIENIIEDANLIEPENLNITILYRRIKHPLSSENIVILETFFID